ncbi:MAG: thiol protease/hemagglutinin PrtT [Bacteroidia bacterium]
MKKVTSFLIAITTFTGVVIASPVPVNSAQQVAANFYNQNSPVPVSTISLAYTEKDNSGNAVYFVFNINGSDGFVIVSADDALHPIIGYSNEGKAYKIPAKGTNVDFWMQKRKAEIINAVASKHTATSEVTDEWTSYMNNKIPQSVLNNKIYSQHNPRSIFPAYKLSRNPVTPVPFKESPKSDLIARHPMFTNPFPSSTVFLVQTDWDQNNPSGSAATTPYIYNSLCPTNCYTGCVATTMAQIMRYWQFPAKGTGSSSYCDCTTDGYTSQFGTLTADYGTTTYHWAEMPYNPSSATDIDTLMYQCGVSVDMDYSTSGSGAQVIGSAPSAQYSYPTYFGYTSNILHGMNGPTSITTAWTDTIEKDLNKGRPVQYAGQASDGGHTWVCDGYNSTPQFHMNWGWNAYDDGWFALNNLDPAGQDAFTSGFQALIGILPPATAPACIGSGTCDTSTNLPKNAYLTYYTAGTNEYVTGTYGDTIQQIADYFTSPPCKGYSIGSVYIYFAKASSKTATTVNVNIWDNTGVGGAPGKILATKAVTVSTISTTAPTLVTFSSPATVTTAYYVGVDFTTLAAAYKTDTICIVTDTNNQALASAWQYDVAAPYSLNGWNPVNSVWGLNISHAIWVDICAPLDAYDYDLEEGIKLYPNPTNGIVNAEVSLEQASDIHVEVYNMLGQLVQQAHWDNVLNSTYTLDLSGQSNGMYFVKIISDKSTITKKIMLNR